jgi:hypothetical protein
MGVMYGDKNVEKALHDMFAAHRKTGEWFERNDSLVSYIDDNAVCHEVYAKVISKVKQPKPAQPDMDKYMLKSDVDRIAGLMDKEYGNLLNQVKELTARVNSLEYVTECNKPLVMFAKENPDVIPQECWPI